MQQRVVFVACVWLVAWGCDGASAPLLGETKIDAAIGSNDSPVASGDLPSEPVRPLDGGSFPRIPKRHRAESHPCPPGRGPGSFTNFCNLDLDAGVPPGEAGCTLDSQCTAGTAGRCLTIWGPLPPGCLGCCSYDQCLSDADCTENAPCECRTSDSAEDPNFCASGGNCRIDADCGPGGYCSPSEIGELCACVGSRPCGEHGYFCHTPNDTCVDDEDCNVGERCSYVMLGQSWACAVCLPPP